MNEAGAVGANKSSTLFACCAKICIARQHFVLHIFRFAREWEAMKVKREKEQEQKANVVFRVTPEMRERMELAAYKDQRTLSDWLHITISKLLQDQAR